MDTLDVKRMCNALYNLGDKQEELERNMKEILSAVNTTIPNDTSRQRFAKTNKQRCKK